METIGNKIAILFPIVSIRPATCFQIAEIRSDLSSARYYGAQWFTTESKFAKNDLKRICYVRCMLTREIQQDTYTGPVTLNPR